MPTTQVPEAEGSSSPGVQDQPGQYNGILYLEEEQGIRMKEGEEKIYNNLP
jgi:hypothetical protein